MKKLKTKIEIGNRSILDKKVTYAVPYLLFSSCLSAFR